MSFLRWKKQQKLGQEAKELMDSELFQSAIQQVRDELVGAIQGSKPSQKEVREDAYIMLKYGERFVHSLSQHIANGKMAEQHLNDQ